VVLIHDDQKVSVIRQAENLETVTAGECLPPHLAQPYPQGPPDGLGGGGPAAGESGQP
jgi:hypothetical protein